MKGLTEALDLAHTSGAALHVVHINSAGYATKYSAIGGPVATFKNTEPMVTAINTHSR